MVLLVRQPDLLYDTRATDLFLGMALIGGGDTVEAIKVKARVGPNRQLIWLEPMPLLSEGKVEVILLYTGKTASADKPSLKWPILNGGRYLGGTLRREEIYDDAR